MNMRCVIGLGLSLALVGGCAAPLTGWHAGSTGHLRARSVLEGLGFAEARGQAEGVLHDEDVRGAVLVEAIGRHLDAKGLAIADRMESGWDFFYREDDRITGVRVSSDGSADVITVQQRGPWRPLPNNLVSPAKVIASTDAVHGGRGPFELTYLADPEGQSSVAYLQNEWGATTVLDAASGKPYLPVRADVSDAEQAALDRIFGAYFDQVLAKNGPKAIAKNALLSAGYLNADEFDWLDTNHDGMLERSEYLAYAHQSGPRFNLHALARQVYDQAAATHGYLDAQQRMIEVPFGVKPGMPSLRVYLDLPLERLQQADPSGQGHLNVQESMVPLLASLGETLPQYPSGLLAGIAFLTNHLTTTPALEQPGQK